MSRLLRWYGASPLHLLAMLGSFALAGYAAAELLRHNPVGILVWFVAAVIGHDLLLMPLYTLADRSAMAVFRHRPLNLPAGPWINYLRVPAVLSGVLLLIWFPLIFRLPTRFPASTTLPLNPYLWHWLAVTGALFLLSATALALRLGAVRRAERMEPTSSQEPAGPPAEGNPAHQVGPEADHQVGPEAAHQVGPEPADQVGPEADHHASQAPAGATSDGPDLDPLTPAGTMLPDADLFDVHGAATTLYAATGDGPSVLVFYQGVWSPHRNIALAAYREHLLPGLTERGIKLVAISPEKPDASLTMQQQDGLGFAVVSDPANAVAGGLGLLLQPSGRARAATVILDASHTVRWIEVHPGHGSPTEPQQVIDALDHLVP